MMGLGSGNDLYKRRQGASALLDDRAPGLKIGRHGRQPVMGVKRRLWRMDDEHAPESDQLFMAKKQHVLQRDNYACCYCDFMCISYLEVHHRDNDHSNNDDNNLETACNLCHQVFHIGFAALRGTCYLAYIPELTQTEVIHLVRQAIMLPIVNGEGYADQAKSLLAIFESRSDYIRQQMRSDLATPATLAQFLSEYPENSGYETKRQFFAREGLRIVPNATALSAEMTAIYSKNCRIFFQAKDLGGKFTDFQKMLKGR